MSKALISNGLKGLNLIKACWFLGVRTEGTFEFPRELKGLKAVKSEFESSKVSDFLEN